MYDHHALPRLGLAIAAALLLGSGAPTAAVAVPQPEPAEGSGEPFSSGGLFPEADLSGGTVGSLFGCEVPPPVSGACEGTTPAPEALRVEVARYLEAIAEQASWMSSESEDSVSLVGTRAWTHGSAAPAVLDVLASYGVRKHGYRDTRGCPECESTFDRTRQVCALFRFERTGDAWRLRTPQCAPGIGWGEFEAATIPLLTTAAPPPPSGCETLKAAGGAPVRSVDVRGARWIAASESGALTSAAGSGPLAEERLGEPAGTVQLASEGETALVSTAAGGLHLVRVDGLDTVRRWDGETRARQVSAHALGPDGAVAVGRRDGTVELWRADGQRASWSRRLEGTISYSGGAIAPVTGLAFSRDGRHLAAGQALHLTTLRAGDGEVVSAVELPSKEPITEVRFLAGDRFLGAMTYPGYRWIPSREGRIERPWYGVTQRGHARAPFAAGEDGRIVTACHACSFAGEPGPSGRSPRILLLAPPKEAPPATGDPVASSFEPVADLSSLLERDGALPSALALSAEGAVVAGYADGAVQRCVLPR